MKLTAAVHDVTEPGGGRLSAVSTEQHAADFATVIIKGFKLPPSAFEWFRSLARQERSSCYAGYHGAAPCAAAAMFIGDHSAWLGIDATLAGYRGQGLQIVLIASRYYDLSQRGVCMVMAETGYQVWRRIASVRASDYQRAGLEVRNHSANLGRNPVCRGQQNRSS